jgi:hypothetical protein
MQAHGVGQPLQGRLPPVPFSMRQVRKTATPVVSPAGSSFPPRDVENYQFILSTSQ